MTDITLRDQGSLIGFVPVTQDANDWFAENVSSEGWQWFGNTLWVDHRLAKELAIAAVAAGLTVGL